MLLCRILLQIVILLAHQTEVNNALAPCIEMYVHMQIHAHTQPQTYAHKHTVTYTHTLSTFCYPCTWRKITTEKINGGGGDKKNSWLLRSCSLSHLCTEHCDNTMTHRSCQNKNIVHRPFDTKISVNSKSSNDSQSISNNKM